MSFTVIEAAQRSPEWFHSRLGRLTGSVAAEMLAKVKSGESAGRRNLRVRLVLERVTGKPQEKDFTSEAMQVGIDREASAFAAYEALTGEVVHRSGFLAHDTLMAGCSLDGHLGNFEELLSIKCRQPAAHLDFLRAGKIPGHAMAQIQHELWITGAAKHHYFSWNPDFPDRLQSSVVTVDRGEVGEYEAAALKFLAEVDTDVVALETMTKGRAG